MPRLKEVAEILIDADTLWNEAGDFSSLARWHPQVSGISVSDEPAGRLRVLRFKAGAEQLERLHVADAEHRVYRYSIERTGLPVRDYTAEFRIEAVDVYRSRLVWEARFTLADPSDDRTVERIRHFLHEGAASLQAKYRPYAEREPDGVETAIADADKKVRTGTANEPIRNTPPAGAWNDTSSD
ncbi:MAG: SRPBCC family protein [Steroidobacteraceae bacterium]